MTHGVETLTILRAHLYYLVLFPALLLSCGQSVQNEMQDAAGVLDVVVNADTQRPQSEDSNTRPQTAIELLGEWEVDNPIPNNPNAPLQGQTLEITSTTWGNSPLITWDNDLNFAVIQSPENDPFFGGLYHRVVWTEPQGFAVYTCQVAQGLETVEQAKFSMAKANDQDFEHGCNGFPWQRLISLSN